MAKHRGLVPVALPNCPRHPGNGGPGGGFLHGQVFGQGARAASGGGGVGILLARLSCMPTWQE